MRLPMISEKEFCEHIEDDDFPIRYGNPVCILTEDHREYVCMTMELYNRIMEMKAYLDGEIKARWTPGGITVEIPEEMAEELREILMKEYGIGIEEALRQYIHWIAEKPDEFKKWIEEIRTNEKTCEYTENLEN